MNFPRTAPTSAAALLARTLFFDTETIPTQRQDIVKMVQDEVLSRYPETVPRDETPAIKAELDAAVHATCLDAAFGQLAVISLAFGEEAPVNIWDPHWQHAGYEAWLLAELYRIVRSRVAAASRDLGPLVGHNIGFDRDFVRQRSIVLGVPALPIFTAEVKPWENDKVFDTMTGWTGDVRKRISQDKLCKALGIDGKGTDLEGGEYIDGSQVWDFIQAGRIKDVATYCGGDVVRARRLYKRLKGLEPVPAPPEFTPTHPTQMPLAPQRRHGFDESLLEP